MIPSFEMRRCAGHRLVAQTWGAVAGAAVGVVGSMMTSNSASSAADSQSAASQQASMLQAQAAAQQRQDLSPWTSSGASAQSTLNRYLGIGGVGSGGTTSLGLSTGLTPDQVRQQLLSRYTTTSNGSGGAATPSEQQVRSMSPLDQYNFITSQAAQPAARGSDGQPFREGQGPGYWEQGIPGNGADQNNSTQRWVSTAGQQGGSSTVDEEGLNAAIAKYYQEQDAQNTALQSDPTYGSLLTPFHNGAEFDPGPAFSFTGENLASDPGYKFGLDQGTQGIDRGQASRGNYLSGAAMKELTKYNEDYAGTKFNDAFNRASSTYGTNLSARQNAWNTNLNAYDTNRSRVYSFLTGVSGLGQASAAGVASGNQQAATSIGNNMMAAGNAQAAGQVASGNALQSGLNTAANSYNSTQQTQAWNNLLAGNSGLSSYDFGSNGQSNPTNQNALTNQMNRYVG